MKAVTLLIALILLTGLAGAELSATTLPDTTKSEPVFSVSGNVITPRIDVGETAVYIEGTEVASAAAVPAGTPITVDGVPGEFGVEIRSIITIDYYWEDFEIIEDGDPLYIDYVSYKRDKKRINFALKGVDLIHPNQLHTGARSTNEELENYSVMLDGRTLYCYPRITTGLPLAFSCSGASYPHTLAISVTVGIVEYSNIVVPEENQKQEVAEEEVIKQEVAEENQENEEIIDFPNEEIEQLDDIILEDSMPVSPESHRSLQIFLILGFVAVMVILFVSSHHKHENKKKGKYQAQKNTVPKAKVQAVLKKQTPQQQAAPERKGAIAQLVEEEKK